jgi:hypothetical protein
MEKKVFLEKTDGLEVAVEHLINAKSDTIILNIPKDSVLGRSVNNFHVLKREGNTAGKALMIESVDDHILELASLATITAVNPVFKRTERAVSDIIPRATAILKKNTFALEKQGKKEERHGSEGGEKWTSKAPAVTFYTEESSSVKNDESIKRKRRKINKTIPIISVLICIGIVFFIYLGWFVLPRASVVITMRQKSIPFDEIVLVSQNYAKTEATDGKILLRGQLVSSKGNLSLPVSGVQATKGDATKARGIITIFNSYGTTPQKLIATTRFQTPDGKIFRIQSDVLIPGGILEKGVLKPGILKAEVVADGAGGSYNVPPIEKWTIPGFKGTPRYEKFYGVSESAMEGGGDETTIVVASSSSSNGETEDSIIEKLRLALEEKKKIVDTVGLKVPEGATSFFVIKKELQISSSSDPMLYVEGVLKEIGFNEDELRLAIFEQTKKEVSETMKMRSLDITYGTSTPDFSSGSFTMKIKGSIIFEENIDIESLKTSILGKKTDEVKLFILSHPWVESAKMSFRFPWLTRIPSDPKKVELKLE